MEDKATIKLRGLREELDITREDIVRVANVSLGTIRNAECGATISLRKANQILKGVNHWRRHFKLRKVNLDELGLVLASPKQYGDLSELSEAIAMSA